MTAFARDTPGNWRQDMVQDVREGLKAEMEARTRRLFDDDVVFQDSSYFDEIEMSEAAALCATLGFGVIYASAPVG